MRDASTWSRLVSSLLLRLCLSLSMVVVAGCGSSVTQDSSAELREVRRFTLEETDSLFLGHFRTITVTRSPYRIYVPDRIGDQIGVFDSLGQIVRFFGSSGEGPGELDRPTKVVVYGSTVYVSENSRFSVLDTSGSFRRIMHLPEGIYKNDYWSLNYYKDQLVIPAVDVSQRRGGSLRMTPEQNSIAIMDTSFREVTMVGQFPKFYREGEYVNRWMSVDISSEGVAATSYSLLNIVDLYALERPGHPPIGTIQMEHPAWKPTTVEMPANMPIPELNRLLTETSRALSVFIVRDKFVVLYFINAAPDYQDRVGDDRASEHFATLTSMGGEQLATLTLPGPIMGHDDDGMLYIRLSSIPDEREFGVYELVVNE